MSSENSGAFSIARTLVVALPLVVIALVVQNSFKASVTGAAQQEMESNMLARLLGRSGAGATTPIEFKDADGDLLADPPADDQCVTPEKLVFTYIASSDPGEMPAHWQGVVDALGEKLGIAAEYAVYDTPQAQLDALAAGELHVCGMNTGAVPVAVKTAGYTPICTFGRADGDFGYRMQVLSPAGSAIKELGDVKATGDKKRVKFTFVQPNSNSGCKAALVLLMDEYNLLPERDYNYGFSLGHETSISGVAGGDFQVVSIASDIFERMAAAGEVDPAKVQVVKESERFPPASLGFAYNLAPAVREAITETLLNFDWAGSGIEGNYGGADAVKFVPVTYKDDWANIRRIDDAVDKARSPK